jgi:hypothetical protein
MPALVRLEVTARQRRFTTETLQTWPGGRVLDRRGMPLRLYRRVTKRVPDRRLSQRIGARALPIR